MEPDEDSIVLSMDEYSRLQTDILNVKHENARLKEISEKYEETQKTLLSSQEELARLLQIEQEHKKIPKFSKDLILDCLKSVRKQETLDKDQSWLIEQVLAIVEFIWPKGGEGEVKQVDVGEIVCKKQNTVLKEENERLKNSLEESKEKYKALAFSLEETAKDNHLKGNKIAELESIKEHLAIDLASREGELTEARKQVKEMYALECSNQDLSTRLDSCQVALENAKKDLAIYKTAPEDSELVKQLKNEVEELKNNENLLSLEYNSFKATAKQTLSDLAQSKNNIKELESTIKKLEDTARKTQQELDDMKTERQILQKRSMHDLKDLKSELAKEKSSHELCKIEKEKVLQENRKLQEHLRAGVKLPPPTHQEKVLVESMAHRVSELESENLNLKHKIREIECFVIENEKLCKENEELRLEISKLSEGMAMMGAKFNEIMRSQKSNY